MSDREIRIKYRKLTELLIERQLTVSTMESCTSGQVASLITDTEGSSAVFRGSFITYSNEAKISCGVPSEVISEYGVYSKETAVQMALVCRRHFRSDIGIGITGTFGNKDPNNSDSEAGVIYFAFSIDRSCTMITSHMNTERESEHNPIQRSDLIKIYKAVLPALNDRFSYKMASAELIVNALLGELL